MSKEDSKLGILERLAKGPVIGDGSTCFTLEKRGYCKAGPFSPEAVVEYPEAVRQLQREYLRAGADVIQTASFYSSDDKLSYGLDDNMVVHTSQKINEAACRIAREVASQGNALVCGGLSPVPSYEQGKSRQIVENEYEKQLEVFREHGVDFLLAEFFGTIDELEIAVSVMKKENLPIATTMRIGIMGDSNGVSTADCAVRMARSGADIVGINCMYDVNTCLKTLKIMKDALNKNDLHPYLMCQPVGWLCPEVETNPVGYAALPEAPFCLEPRQITRIEGHAFARAAWELGVRYIGGCCGIEPHHIRAFAQELRAERGRDIPGISYCEPFGGETMKQQSLLFNNRSTREYWLGVVPGNGRPFNPTLSRLKDEISFTYDVKS